MFLISEAKKTFTELKQVFVETPILNHFNLERHIRIETDISDFAISGVLSQLTLDDLAQWHLVAFSFRKMIPTEIQYEIYDGELMAIVEAFKTWRYYLKGYKHEVLVLIDHNNLQYFMDIKSLSFRQVR